MGLVLSIALGIVVAVLVLTFLPELLQLALILGGIAVIGGIVILVLTSNTSSSEPARSPTVSAWSPPTAAWPNVAPEVLPTVEFASLSDRIRSGPEVGFQADEARGSVVSAVELPDGRTKLFVRLTLSPESTADSWTTERAAQLLRPELCGAAGLIRRFREDPAKVEVVLAGVGAQLAAEPVNACRTK